MPPYASCIIVITRPLCSLYAPTVKRIGDVVYLSAIRECGIGKGSNGVVAVGVAADIGGIGV